MTAYGAGRTLRLAEASPDPAAITPREPTEALGESIGALLSGSHRILLALRCADSAQEERSTIHGRSCSMSALETLRSWKRSVEPIDAPPFSSSQKVRVQSRSCAHGALRGGIVTAQRKTPPKRG